MATRRRAAVDLPVLCGPRVRLRPLAAHEHTAAWRRWLEDPEVARWLGSDAVDPVRYTMGIELVGDGLLIGGLAFADLSEDRRAELVIAIGEAPMRGRGYGREAIELAVSHAFAALRLREVFLRVRPDNDPAIRCYVACGFRKEGVLSRASGDGPMRVLLMSRRRAG